MAAGSFERALALVLELEGGFVDHPRDPGGATKFGITRATLAEARGRPASVADIRALTRAEAAAIYRRLYWREAGCDALPPGLDLATFDLAVHSGPQRALRLLQGVLGLKQDGVVGPATRAAAERADARHLILALTRERFALLRRLETWPTFGRGWSARVRRVEATALALAAAADARLSGAKRLAALPPTDPEENTMIDTKPVLASRTVWANLIGLVAVGIGLFGIDASGAEIETATEALVRIVAGASCLAGIYFRVTATKQIAPPRP
jgi:lysozyme family protein